MKVLKNKKIFFIILMFLILLLIISRQFYGKKDKLPNQYKNYRVLDEETVKLNYFSLLGSENSILDTKIILINDTKGYPAYMGFSKIILLRDDGYFLELPGYGEGFEWWQVGDLNNNGYLDVAVLYQNMGSGSFQPFYFYEWNGYNFDVKLQNSDLFNCDELADLDNDGRMEIVHEFRVSQFAWPWKEIYKWDKEKQEFIKANNLFPASYAEWLRDKELEPEDSSDFYNSPQNQDTIEINNCLKEKAILNSKGVFADIDECQSL